MDLRWHNPSEPLKIVDVLANNATSAALWNEILKHINVLYDLRKDIASFESFETSLTNYTFVLSSKIAW